MKSPQKNLPFIKKIDDKNKSEVYDIDEYKIYENKNARIGQDIKLLMEQFISYI